MTADKHQHRAQPINSNLSRGQGKSAMGTHGGDRTSPGRQPGSLPETAARRLQMCRTPPPANGKLAGFGPPAPAEIQPPCAAVPIWFAALIAIHCHARAKDEQRDVRWNCVSGRAVYTNHGAEEETIEPLGICLQGGQTLAVSWIPGQTSYTVEIFPQFECVEPAALPAARMFVKSAGADC